MGWFKLSRASVSSDGDIFCGGNGIWAWIWKCGEKTCPGVFVLPNSPLVLDSSLVFPRFVPKSSILSFIDFYFVLFYFVCFPQTSHLSSAERLESAENPTGKTFPGWKLPPGRNGTLGFEGKRANPRNFTKSLEAELPEAFATHEALVHEGAARGLGRDLRGQERGDQRIYPTFPWI